MSNRDVIDSYLSAFYQEPKNYGVIENLLDEAFQFVGPLGSFSGRSAFMKFLLDSGPQQIEIEIKTVIVDGNDVVVFHDFTSHSPAVGPIPFVEKFSVVGGKIKSLELYYDTKEVEDAFSKQA